MIHSADEAADVDFTVGHLMRSARQMPVADAAKLLRGFLLVTDPDRFPEIASLYLSITQVDAQLELLAANPRRKAA